MDFKFDLFNNWITGCDRPASIKNSYRLLISASVSIAYCLCLNR